MGAAMFEDVRQLKARGQLSHPRYPRGRLLPLTVALLLCSAATSVHAANVTGLAGSNGSNASAGTPGTGGDGAGNSGSGAAGQTTGAAGTGVAGSTGTAGGGGGGGGDFVYATPVSFAANGGAGGDGEFGTGGAGGTVTSAAGGGRDEAGGGGGFGASGSGSSGGGGGGGGGRGLTITASTGTIDLGDTVTGGTGGKGGAGDGNIYADGGGGGGGGIGVVFGGTGLLTVSGSIVGGTGGQGGDGASGGGSYGGSGGYGGTGLRVSSSGATVYVDGSITGGDGGNRGASGYVPTKAKAGAGGASIVGADLAVIMAADGSISGGLSGDGTTRADAVTFTGGANSFELQADTGTIIGHVTANGSDDVFRLGGTSTSNSFDTSKLGDQFTGFERFEKTGTGTWVLAGTPGLSATWTITEGTLSLPGSMAASIETSGAGIFALSGGQLDGTLDNAATTIASGGITGAVTNRAGGTLQLTGDLAIGGTLENLGTLTAFGALTPSTFAISGNGGITTSGTISLHQQAGLSGDVLDLTAAGPFEAVAGGSVLLDIDLSSAATAAADRLSLGSASGTLDLQFNPDPAHYGAIAPDLLVLSTTGGNLTVTGSGLVDRGVVSYALEQMGNDWYVTSRLDVAPLGGLVSMLVGTGDVIDLVAKPAAPPLSSSADGSCASGLTTRLAGGRLPIAASTTAGGNDTASVADLGYGGVELDLSSPCQTLASGAGTYQFGLIASALSGTGTTAQSFSDGETLAATSDFQSLYAGLYGRLAVDHWVADLQAGIDGTGFDLSALSSADSTPVLDSSSSALRLSASGTLGYRLEANGLTITPSVGLALSQNRIDTIALTDLGGELSFDDRLSAALSAGLQLAGTHVLAETGATLKTYASGSISADLGSGQGFVYSDSANAPVALETEPQRLRGTLSAGIDYALTGSANRQAVLGLKADLTAAGTDLGTGLSVKAGVSF